MAVEVKWTTQSLEDIENIANFIAKDSDRIDILTIYHRSRLLSGNPLFEE